MSYAGRMPVRLARCYREDDLKVAEQLRRSIAAATTASATTGSATPVGQERRYATGMIRRLIFRDA